MWKMWRICGRVLVIPRHFTASPLTPQLVSVLDIYLRLVTDTDVVAQWWGVMCPSPAPPTFSLRAVTLASSCVT